MKITRLPWTRYQSEIYAALLPTYLNGESVDKTDIVVWYTGSVHHLVRDEDRQKEGGYMALVMWTEFQLKPHNLFGSTPLYP
jgi:Cu2+-containing amine oxidase